MDGRKPHKLERHLSNPRKRIITKDRSENSDVAKELSALRAEIAELKNKITKSGLNARMDKQGVIPLHKHGLSTEKTQEILKLWYENAERFPEKSAAYLVKLTAGQARVDFADVVWAIIEDSRRG